MTATFYSGKHKKHGMNLVQPVAVIAATYRWSR